MYAREFSSSKMVMLAPYLLFRAFQNSYFLAVVVGHNDEVFFKIINLCLKFYTKQKNRQKYREKCEIEVVQRGRYYKKGHEI